MKPRSGLSRLQHPYESVFKVDVPSRRVGDCSAEEPSSYHARKAHKKSRGGCEGCKKRRLKCDEQQPTCSRCLRTDVACVYQKRMAKASHCQEISPDCVMHGMAINLLESDLERLLGGHLSGKCGPRILQHFQTATLFSVGDPLLQSLMQQHLFKSAWDRPYLMHTSFAVSCAHMKRLDIANDFGIDYSLAEATHWQQALKLYQAELNTGRPDLNASIATTFLSVMYVFALEDERAPSDESSFGNGEDMYELGIAPLAACGGLRALVAILGPMIGGSSTYAPYFRTSDDGMRTFTDEEPGIRGLPPAFVELCGLDEGSTSRNNEYHKIVRLLTPILMLAPGPQNFSKLFSFIGRIWFESKPLLVRRDERTLLLISYWLALVRQIDQWWITTRVKTACAAIVSCLTQSADPKICRLLEYPASFGESGLSRIWQRSDD